MEDAYTLYDLEGSNGTFVNGKRVKGTKLADGNAGALRTRSIRYRAQTARATGMSPDSGMA